jgi:hypothetical protein
MRPSPSLQKFIRIGQLDLQVEAPGIESERRVMALVAELHKAFLTTMIR